MANANNGALITNPGAYPQVGFPYFSVFAYAYAGLDAVGDPQLYVDGQASKNYAAAINTNNRANVKFMGSSVPTTFGNIRNSLSYKNVELSLNITYRLGYLFRRSSLNNQSIYTTTGFTNHTDYERRWMKPGDENFTQVPALRYPNIAARSNAYTYSDILIETADNIRLQDIRLDYRINAKRNKGRAINLYCYFNNIGYLWKANKLGLDPDNPRPELGMISFPRTIAFGIKSNL
ncbi:MAG: hypothetical protein EOO42_01830 [Flavobacteriales bacterium]|nr:MAG: hypothetical protein EOO42_01830 [Flavobacteriales bacterium]